MTESLKYSGKKTKTYLSKLLINHMEAIQISNKILGFNIHESKKCSVCVANKIELYPTKPMRVYYETSKNEQEA